ncbi:MAG: hypothetical protein NT159_22910 [Proteobacteria bacterium]|nr:hypothetical protein [Pseudomonadota bacterium]
MARKVVFDSNTWRKVASPSKFPNDQDIAVYQKIHAACQAGTITGLLSETTFTLEQIKRDDRLSWIKSGTQVAITETTDIPGVIGIRIVLMPSKTIAPANINMVKEHLNDALQIGIRILRSKRIAGPKSPILTDQFMFVGYASDEEFHQFNNQSGEVARDLERLGVGIANIKSLGNTHTSDEVGIHWTDGIASLPETDENKRKVAEMVAEWADTDALAASIAHGAEFFCTNDMATGSTNKGVRSIMLSTNVAAVTQKYGIQFVNPQELATKLAL